MTPWDAGFKARQHGEEATTCPTCKSFYRELVPSILLAPGEKQCTDRWHYKTEEGALTATDH